VNCVPTLKAKNLADINAVIGMNDMGWDGATLNRYSSLFGLGMFFSDRPGWRIRTLMHSTIPANHAFHHAEGMFFSGPIGSSSIGRLGAVMHTRITQLLAAAMYLTRGAFLSSSVAFGVIPLALYSGTHGITAKTDGVVLAMAAGMKKGELSGYSANLRALVGGIAPLIYAQLYVVVALL
jgi:hypothetical protein